MSQISSTATIINSLKELPPGTPICQVEIINGKARVKDKAGFRDQYLGARNRSITPVGTGNPVDNFFDGATETNQKFVQDTGKLLGKNLSPLLLEELSQPHTTVDRFLTAMNSASGSNEIPSL